MQFARELFVEGVTRATLLAEDKKAPAFPAIGGVVGFMAPQRPSRPDPEKGRRTRNARKKQIENNIALVWFCVVLIAVVLSLIFLVASHGLLGEYRPGVILTTLLWDFVAGGFVLFVAPAKIVTALAGLLFGSGASDLSGPKGVVMRIDEIAQLAVIKLGFLQTADGSDAGFVTAMVWLFLSLFFVLCLVAFKKN